MNALILCDETLVYREHESMPSRIPGLVSLLEGAGFTATTVTSTVAEAIEAVQHQTFQLAVIEWAFYYDDSELPQLLKDTPIFFIAPGVDFTSTKNHFISPSMFIGWYTQPLEFRAYVRRLFALAEGKVKPRYLYGGEEGSI